MKRMRYIAVGFLGLTVLLGGCPAPSDQDEIAGGSGDNTQLGTESDVQVLSPVTDLSIAGGAPVEVNWNVVATTNFASVRIIFDTDLTPDNGNETVALRNLGIGETSALLDTSRLARGRYNIGIVLLESNVIAAFGYAEGQIVINQAPLLTFQEPRQNSTFDRTLDTQPLFEVAWTLSDPDSVVTTEIYLDPDATPNGNEIKLRESTSQTGDSFSFNLPTLTFEPGSYRILAIVSDGVDETAFYAPATIRLRARLAGWFDLRDLGGDDSPVRGAIFEGVNPRDNAGSFVSSLGDYDGDGFGDIMIGAQFAKPNFNFNSNRVGVGEAYMIYGRQTPFSGRINLNSTGALFRGEVFTGVRETENPVRPTRGITSFALLSDWDRDGVREMAFGLPFVDSLPSLDGISTLDAVGYFRSGSVVISTGYNLRPDLAFAGGNVVELTRIGSNKYTDTETFPSPCPESLIGPKSPPSPFGDEFTYFYAHLLGTASGSVDTIRQGCRLSTNDFNDQCGESISAYQFDSIMVSVPNRDPAISAIINPIPSAPQAGMVSVYFARSGGDSWPWRTENAPAAGNGWNPPDNPPGAGTMPDEGPFHYILDDYRTDGFFARPRSPSYFVDPDNGEPCLRFVNEDMPGPSNTLRILGADPGGRLNNARGIDDFNGDGLDDILVGYPFGNGGDGACYVVFGRLRELMRGAEVSVNEFEFGLNDDDTPRIFDGIQIVGEPGSRLGETQDRLGDFNGDGVPDVVMGSRSMNDQFGGCVVLFGKRGLISTNDRDIPLQEIPERGLGIIFVGDDPADSAGIKVASAGDVDNDGLDDLLIAAPDKSVRLDIDQDGQIEIDRAGCGVVYLVYGSTSLSGRVNLADIGTEALPGMAFIGRNSGDALGAGQGEQGDRANGINFAGDVNGDGIGDLLITAISASPESRTRAGEAYLLYGVGD